LSKVTLSPDISSGHNAIFYSLLSLRLHDCPSQLTVIFEISFTTDLCLFISQSPASSALVYIEISFRRLHASIPQNNKSQPHVDSNTDYLRHDRIVSKTLLPQVCTSQF
jgi:hypothetical protein